jgi:carbamoyl-phosphate synthase large subunit
MELGYEVIGLNIFTDDDIPAKQFCDNFYLVPHSDEETHYVNMVLSLCDQHDFDYILPLTDPEAFLLSSHADFLLNRGIKLLTSSRASLISIRDKWNIFLLGKEWETSNFKPIPTFKDISDAISIFGFPVICKPSIGRSSQGIQIVESGKSYVKSNGTFIFQPYLAGTIITIDAIRIEKDKFFYCLPRVEIERTSKGAGTKVLTFKDPLIDEFIKHILEFFNIDGCVNIELLKTENCYYLMDFNLRLSAGIEFSYISGADFLGALLNEGGLDTEKFFNHIDSSMMQRIDSKVYKYS